MKVDTSIFKAYDICGVVDQTLTEDAVRAVGRVLGSMALDKGVGRFCVGRDGRLTGERLQNALVEGIASTGMDVLDVGAMPTPVLYYATKYFDCGTGVAVTRSHNPPEYNGLKMMVAGVTLFADQIQNIRERIEREDWLTAVASGSIERVDAVTPYVEKVIDGVRISHRLKVVVDAGNGIAGPVMLRILSKLDVDVVPLYCDVDGHFPNHHPDPSKPKNLEMPIRKVKEVGADYGFALDGDGDRLGVVTNEGEVIYPDRLMMLFSEDILRSLPGAEIVYDVKCSRKLVDWIREKGGEPVISPTGHSLVKAKLRETGAPFAGEMSGHLFFNDERWTGFDEVFILPFVFSKFSREAKRLHPFFMSCRMRSTRRKSRSRQKKTGTRRSSPRSRRNVVFPMRNPSSRSTGFVPSGRTCLLQYDTRGGRTFRRRLKGIARAHPAVLHCRYTSRRHCIEDPITQRRKP